LLAILFYINETFKKTFIYQGFYMVPLLFACIVYRKSEKNWFETLAISKLSSYD